MYKQCQNSECDFLRETNNKSEKLITFIEDKSSDVEMIDNRLYYFHLSCGSPCGYGHYVTAKNLLIIADSEILFDKKKQCLIYTAKSDNKKDNYDKLLAYDFKNLRSKVIYDFNTSKYNNEEYQELLNLEPLHQIFKKDAFLDDNGTLFLYAFGKEDSKITLKINNVCK